MKKILEKKRNTVQVEKQFEPKTNSSVIATDLIDSVKRKVAVQKSKSLKRQKK